MASPASAPPPPHPQSWAMGLCKGSRAQKPSSHLCHPDSFTGLCCWQREQEGRVREATETGPRTLKTLSPGLILRSGGRNLRIYTATCTPGCNTCFTGDLSSTLLSSLYSSQADEHGDILLAFPTHHRPLASSPLHEVTPVFSLVHRQIENRNSQVT